MAEKTYVDIGRAAPVVKGTWSSATAYNKLNIVSNSSASYIARKDVPAGTLLTNTEYWTKLASDGASPAVIGAWSSSTAYSKLNIVTNGGVSYIAKIDVPAGTALSNTTYWMQLTTVSSITPMGEWDYDDAYNKDDLVDYAYNSYLAKQAVPAETDLTDTDYWAKIACGAAMWGTWNSQVDYPALSMVTDSNGYNTYSAIRNVPAGTAVTDTSYWRPVSMGRSVTVLASELRSSDTQADAYTKCVYAFTNNIPLFLLSKSTKAFNVYICCAGSVTSSTVGEFVFTGLNKTRASYPEASGCTFARSGDTYTFTDLSWNTVITLDNVMTSRSEIEGASREWDVPNAWTVATALDDIDTLKYNYVSSVGVNSPFWRKWSNGMRELWGYKYVSNMACDTQLWSGVPMYFTGVISPGFTYPSTLFPTGCVIHEQITFIDSCTGSSTPAFVLPIGPQSGTSPASVRLMRPASTSAVSGTIYYHCVACDTSE